MIIQCRRESAGIVTPASDTVVAIDGKIDAGEINMDACRDGLLQAQAGNGAT